MEPCRELRLSNSGQLELLKGFAARGAVLRTTVLGSSMSPFVRDRDVVTIAPFNGRSPRAGDVAAVALERPERLLIHRLIRRDAGGWLIRGDACPQADGVAAPSELLGRIVRVERAGRVVRFGTTGGVRGGAVVAALSRSGALSAGIGSWRRLRAAAAAGARRLQGAPMYRRLGRRLASAVSIAEVAPGARRSQATEEAVRATAWAARLRGQAVGGVHLVVQPDRLDPWAGYWLHSLAVRAPVRGLGIGAALARAVVERARLEGAAELLLAVQQDNARAIALYRKLGFEDVVLPRLEPILADELERLGRRRVVMRLLLAAAS